jgi:ankyrin repeat protein
LIGGEPCIMIECRERYEVIRVLIDSGHLDVNAHTHSGWTPLHWAGRQGDKRTVRMLVERGADVHALDPVGNTPLHLAIGHGEEDESVSDGPTFDLDCTWKCSQLIALLAAGADVTIANDKQSTPLHLAATDCSTKLCTLLVKQGADINARDDTQSTPLHLAVWQEIYFPPADGPVVPGPAPMVTLAAAVNAGERPSWWTVNGSTTMTLLFHGADATALDAAGRTAAAIARSRGLLELAEHLELVGGSAGEDQVRCTGPNLVHQLVWNSSSVAKSEPRCVLRTLLGRMQRDWLVAVAEGCEQAKVGVTLQGVVKQGWLPASLIVHIMGFLFGGTQTHLMSCVSEGRVPVAVVRGCRDLATVQAGSILAPVPATYTTASEGGVPPRLALISHMLAACVTPAAGEERIATERWPGCPSSRKNERAMRQNMIMSLLSASEVHAGGGCEWLWRYCDFLRRSVCLGVDL